jgi:hypothetical protein
VTVEGIDYSPEGIETIRVALGELRDTTFAHWPEAIPATLALTHAIAQLAYLKEILEGDEWRQR